MFEKLHLWHIWWNMNNWKLNIFEYHVAGRGNIQCRMMLITPNAAFAGKTYQVQKTFQKQNRNYLRRGQALWTNTNLNSFVMKVFLPSQIVAAITCSNILKTPASLKVLSKLLQRFLYSEYENQISWWADRGCTRFHRMLFTLKHI